MGKFYGIGDHHATLNEVTSEIGREASYDVLVCLVMSNNLAMIPGIVGYREINVRRLRRRSYSYDI